MRLLIPLIIFCAVGWAQEYGENYRLKIPVAGESRKGVLFLPKSAVKGKPLPLIVAIPDSQGRAFLELAQWQEPSNRLRFGVFSVDCTTSGIKKPWHPNDQLDMQRDMEATTEGLKLAHAKAKELGYVLDDSATVITGHSGGTFLVMWLGIRRPDLFMGICGRSVVFFKETVDFGRYGNIKPNYSVPIFLYRGELDAARPKKETEIARKTLETAGFKNVSYRVVPKMTHQSRPEIFLEWYEKLLKETAGTRRERRRILHELDKLRPMVAKGKHYSKLAKLAERERKVGVDAGAGKLLDGIVTKAKKRYEQAENLHADNQFLEAATIYREIEKAYSPLPISKSARKERAKLIKSDEYKAAEMLVKARALIDKGNRDRAYPILQRIVDKYPKTVAAESADHLLKGG